MADHDESISGTSGELTHQSYPEDPERTLRRVMLDCPGSASIGTRYVAKITAAGFLYLGEKLDRILGVVAERTSEVPGDVR